jgi:hypothetical protein
MKKIAPKSCIPSETRKYMDEGIKIASPLMGVEVARENALLIRKRQVEAS